MATYAAGTIRPTRIPNDKQIMVGNAVIHSSHQVMLYRGLYFCRHCASWAIKKLENLASPCDPSGRGPEDAMRKGKAVLQLLRGKLPRGCAAFPNSTPKLLELNE